MRRVFFAWAVVFGSVFMWAAPLQAQADNAAAPGQSPAGVTLDGTIEQVDSGRDKVDFTGDNGRTYTLDTYRCRITLLGTNQPGQTGDLAPGMRLHILGTLLSSDVIEASKAVVLPLPSSAPFPPPSQPKAVPSPVDGQRITLRGTVDTVDQRADSFVVRVKDHTRMILVTPETDLEDLDLDDRDSLPLHIGQRVTVIGHFSAQGTVEADTVTPHRLDDPDAGSASNSGHIIAGRVSRASGYFSRDIKLRISDGSEMTIHVPKDAQIRRDGQAISIHQIAKDTFIRVFGEYNGADFDAMRLDLLANSIGPEADSAGDHDRE